MKPGPELDAMIHDRVMGRSPELIAIATSDGGQSAAVVESSAGPFYSELAVRDWIASTGKARGYQLAHWKRCPPYSTDLASAWEIENAVAERGWFMELIRISGGWRSNFRKWMPERDPNGAWYEVHAFGQSSHPDTDPDQSGHTYAPHAICLAALKTLDPA